MKFVVISFFVSFLTTTACTSADAAPTAQEKAAFFAQQKEQQQAFDLKILEETDPRGAAAAKYNNKANEERAAFIKSLSGLPQNERSQSLAEYNRKAQTSRKEFEKKVVTLPLSKNPKISDLVKKRREFEQDRVKKVRDFFAETE